MFSEGVIESVVPGQTRNSPPLDKLRTAVSAPAENEVPTLSAFDARAIGPAARIAFTTGCGAEVRVATVGG